MLFVQMIWYSEIIPLLHHTGNTLNSTSSTPVSQLTALLPITAGYQLLSDRIEVDTT